MVVFFNASTAVYYLNITTPRKRSERSNEQHKKAHKK